jgi:DNA transposition AAA+ family ATPase
MTNGSVVTGATLARLEEAIQQASSQYSRLVILAGVPGSGKTAALRYIAQTTGCPVVGDSGEAERSFRREAERHSGMIPNTIGA